MKVIAKIRKISPDSEVQDRSVRLVDVEGKQLGVLTLKEALDEATKAELDLVEVAPNADPPVCRIMDYDRVRYQRVKKRQKGTKKQVIVHVKEVRIRPNTDEHDFQFKVRHIKRFLEDKNKAKVTIIFRGREITHNERGREVLERIVEEVKDLGTVEQVPLLEGRNMTMILSPKRVN